MSQKTCIAMRKRFEENGYLITQDCLTGQVVKKEVLKRQMVVPTITATAPVTEPFVEIPHFFLTWQLKRDQSSAAK